MSERGIQTRLAALAVLLEMSVYCGRDKSRPYMAIKIQDIVAVFPDCFAILWLAMTGLGLAAEATPAKMKKEPSCSDGPVQNVILPSSSSRIYNHV
jgi:hypothetical protein